MTETVRASAMCALAAVEINLSELQEIKGWWEGIGAADRYRLREFQATVREYQHSLQSPPLTLDRALARDGG